MIAFRDFQEDEKINRLDFWGVRDEDLYKHSDFVTNSRVTYYLEATFGLPRPRPDQSHGASKFLLALILYFVVNCAFKLLTGTYEISE